MPRLVPTPSEVSWNLLLIDLNVVGPRRIETMSSLKFLMIDYTIGDTVNLHVFKLKFLCNLDYQIYSLRFYLNCDGHGLDTLCDR